MFWFFLLQKARKITFFFSLHCPFSLSIFLLTSDLELSLKRCVGGLGHFKYAIDPFCHQRSPHPESGHVFWVPLGSSRFLFTESCDSLTRFTPGSKFLGEPVSGKCVHLSLVWLFSFCLWGFFLSFFCFGVSNVWSWCWMKTSSLKTGSDKNIHI